MGWEAKCRVEAAGTVFRADVHLDSKELTIRASKRKTLVVALADMVNIASKTGWVEFAADAGAVRMELGKDAERWALKMRYPKQRLEKLGVKAGMKIVVLGIDESDFLAELSTSGATIGSRLTDGCDLIFYGVHDPAQLSELKRLRTRIAPAGAIWIVRTKGKGAAVSEGAVRDAAKQASLVDIKVVSFSETQSAEKLVIPVSLRKK
jgi:hypothetical protein